MSPPITPSAIHGPATAGSKAVRTWDHTQAAGTATRNSRNAALFTVPSSVMAGAVGSRRRSADRKSTRLNSSHTVISYAVFCLKKKKKKEDRLKSKYRTNDSTQLRLTN